MTHAAVKDFTGAKLGMWLFLFSELLLFGGLFLLYAIYLARYPRVFAAGGKELDVFFGTLNTVVLLTSSLLAALSVTAVQKDQGRRALLLLGGTITCAALFLGIKAIEWGTKFSHDIYPGSARMLSAPAGESVFFSLYYLTTGLHGLHVLVGAIVLSFVARKVATGRVHRGDYILLENGTLYWHLVDIIWIFIFPLYYLIL